MLFLRFREFLIIFLILLSSITIITLKVNTNTNSPEGGYLLNQFPIEGEFPISNEVKQLIVEINQKNKKIKSFSCEEVRVYLRNRQIFRVVGEILYQKDRKFRMFINSFRGLELDIGSNNDHFWFWSRDMKPQALYYSSYEDIQHTKLKTPFHPIWLKAILGFDLIQMEKIKATNKRGPYLEILSEAKNMQNKPIIRGMVIDPTKRSIIGHYIYEDNILICSAEVFEDKKMYGMSVPAKMVIKWYQEDITMVWELDQQSINPTIFPKMWNMPDKYRKIYIGN